MPPGGSEQQLAALREVQVGLLRWSLHAGHCMLVFTAWQQQKSE
jgi:hypothetical protein